VETTDRTAPALVVLTIYSLGPILLNILHLLKFSNLFIIQTHHSLHLYLPPAYFLCTQIFTPPNLMFMSSSRMPSKLRQGISYLGKLAVGVVQFVKGVTVTRRLVQVRGRPSGRWTAGRGARMYIAGDHTPLLAIATCPPSTCLRASAT
jgi:hypothetical protein